MARCGHSLAPLHRTSAEPPPTLRRRRDAPYVILVGMTRSTVFRWAVQSVGPQMMLRRAAKNGELGARLAIDRSLWPDPFPTYERMRAIGEMQHGGLGSSTTSPRIASEVLRSPAFRVGIGSSEQLSPFARRMLSAATDPDAVGPAEPPSMLAVDPPQHSKYRRLLSKGFHPRGQ